MIVIVMGVAGSGKTTVGKLLARRLGWCFYEGDGFHPVANIEKMSAGVPLTDGDRWPWLESIKKELDRCSEQGTHAVVACSALRDRYRSYLAADISDLRFIYLKGDPPTIRERLKSREHHYMGASMLESQLASLEEPEGAILVDIAHPPDEIVARIRAALEPVAT